MIQNSEKKSNNLQPCIIKGLSSHTPHISASLTMKVISSADKINVISLLSLCHSIRKVESITGLVESTVGRIYLELEIDKENHKGGRSSMLFPANQRRIDNQIIMNKLDNAVQATKYINTIIQKPFCPQIVRNALKRYSLNAVVKANKSLLKVRHRQSLFYITRIVTLRTGRVLHGQIRPRLTGLGHM